MNGQKLDNRAENLDWCSRAENNRRAAALGLLKGKSAGSKNPNAKLSDEKVVEMRRKSAEGSSYTKLAAEYEVTVPTAYRAVVGKLWGHVPAEPALSPHYSQMFLNPRPAGPTRRCSSSSSRLLGGHSWRWPPSHGAS